MKLLLDTHCILWHARQSAKLSPAARKAIADPTNERFLSVVSLWEMGIKFAKGRLPEAKGLLESPDELTRFLLAELVPMGLDEVLLAPKLAWDHADPFDRMLAAQAIVMDAALVTCDPQFSKVPGLVTLW